MATVQGQAPPVLSSVSQPKVPPDQVRTLLVWQVVSPAPLKRAVKRFVELAVVEKKLVEVPFTPEKFWKVEEAFTKRLLKVPRPVAVMAFTESKPLAFRESAAVLEVAQVVGEEVAR